MLRIIKDLAKSLGLEPTPQLKWIKKGSDSWLFSNLPKSLSKIPRSSLSEQIEKIARNTNNLGKFKLWKGYNITDGLSSSDQVRSSNQVRTSFKIGNFYSWLVKTLAPKVVIEFGAAFGVSGMYFLSGLTECDKGVLYSFEPNEQWAQIAMDNFDKISSKYNFTIGTFEENVNNVFSEGLKIDLAFIDAIHTREFVMPQLVRVLEFSKIGTIIILDDINFSKDMEEVWSELALDNRFRAAVKVGKRVGILEYNGN